jgi:hypothetical protein
VTRREYAEYLRTPHWRRFRKTAAKKLERVCPCGARTALDLHHMTYERIGHERLTDVAWLCRDCHDALHKEDPAGGLFDPSRAVKQEPRTYEPSPEKRLEMNRAILRDRKRKKRENAKRPPGKQNSVRQSRYGGYLAKRKG